MAQKWNDGSAARQPSYEETSPSASSARNYAPGQLYGTPRRRTYPEAPRPSAPPMAAPRMDTPSYLQQAQPGTPYSAGMFHHQPTAVMPKGWEEKPFADRPQDAFSWDVPAPVWEEDVEEASQPAEPEDWRDPFTPAQQAEEKKAESQPKRKKKKAQKPPVRAARVLALAAAAGMLLFCCIAGGTLIADLVQSERGLEAARSEYRQQTGMELAYGGAKVDLLPKGQTYVPTSTPSPTVFAPTPSPTPIIPINEAAVLGLSGYSALEVSSAGEPSPAPVLRTKLSGYPDNPMRNVLEVIQPLVKGNADVIGHLVIDGVLDEIVMQRNNTFYLNHNSLGSYSEAGAVFADESCTLRQPPENLLLRGQSSVPGKTFEPLWQFVSGGSEFVSTHMTAELTTLYEQQRYVLFAVLVADGSPASDRYFNYASHPTFLTDEEMLRYVESARQSSLYQFNVDVTPDDRLLTLATLGSGENSLVLMYRSE